MRAAYIRRNKIFSRSYLISATKELKALTNFVKNTQIHTKTAPNCTLCTSTKFTTHTYACFWVSNFLFFFFDHLFQLSLYIIVTHTHNRQQGAKKSKKALQTEKEIKNGENGGREENNRLGCERPFWVTLSLHLHSQVHFSSLSIYDMNLFLV